MSKTKYQHIIRNHYSKPLLTAGILTTIGILPLSLSNIAFADTTSTDTIRLTVPVTCSMTATVNNAHTATVDINQYTEDIGKTTIETNCNDTYGNNTMITPLGSDLAIVSGTATSGNTSNWSMKLTAIEDTENPTNTPTITNGFDNYSIVPTNYTRVVEGSTNTVGTTGAKFTSTYATYVSPTQVASTYEGKVKYTLVHPGVDNIDLPDTTMYSMQNVSTWKDTVDAGETVFATDERDGEIYTVARLADGKLWMTKNLRLNLAKANLTTENTNTTNQAFLDAAMETEETDNWCMQNTEACLDRIAYATISIGDDTIDSRGHRYDEYGAYYNWYTATAGAGTAINEKNASADEDICPTGWHLPIGGDREMIEAGKNDLYNLATEIITAEPTWRVNYGGGLEFAQWDDDPASSSEFINGGKLTLSGIGVTGGYYRGTYGYLWTSTTHTSASAQASMVGDSIINITLGTGKYYPLSIRCLTN